MYHPSAVITIDQQGALAKRMRRENEEDNDDADDDNSGIASCCKETRNQRSRSDELISCSLALTKQIA
mgnify:CR=1 FL=1